MKLESIEYRILRLVYKQTFIYGKTTLNALELLYPDGTTTKIKGTLKKLKEFIEVDKDFTNIHINEKGVRKVAERIKHYLTTGVLDISPSSYKRFIDYGPRGLLNYFMRPKKATEAMIIGSAMDTYILDPLDFTKKFVIFDPELRPEPTKNFGSKLNKEWKAKFEEEHKGKEILSLDTYDMIKKVAEDVKLVGEFFMDLREGESQTKWEGKFEDVKIRGYSDLYVPNRKIWDLKKVVDARFSKVEWTIKKEYLPQAAFYYWLSGEECKFSFLCFDTSGNAIEVAVWENRLVTEVDLLRENLRKIKKLFDKQCWDLGAEFVHGSSFMIF